MHKHKVSILAVLKRERKFLLIVDDVREAVEELCKVFQFLMREKEIVLN